MMFSFSCLPIALNSYDRPQGSSEKSPSRRVFGVAVSRWRTFVSGADFQRGFIRDLHCGNLHLWNVPFGLDRAVCGQSLIGHEPPLGISCSSAIGVPAAYALVQERRYHSPDNETLSNLDEPISAPFQGILRLGVAENEQGVKLSKAFQALEDAYWKMLSEGREVKVDLGTTPEAGYAYYKLTGKIELHPIGSEMGPAVEGRFIGQVSLLNPNTNSTQEAGESVELKLSSEVGRFKIDPKVYADRERALKIPVADTGKAGRPERVGVLRGTIPRPVGDWLAVPLESEKLSRLHYDLGKTFDLAMVYTWVAALLNVLVLWDAFEGPAYGYGDETPEGDADAAKPGTGKSNAEKTDQALAANPAAS